MLKKELIKGKGRVEDEQKRINREIGKNVFVLKRHLFWFKIKNLN